MKFEVKGNQFFKDDKAIKIISGAVHYFRNMPDTWCDIFRKLRALGCNCVETYCAWNMHEKKQGEYCFDGILDIADFIRKAAAEGLMVIVRLGPYICAEWEFGGTNFGFTSGANHDEKFAPDVTSYDYDALLSECGDVTPKYYAVRDVIKKYVDEPLPEVPPNRPKKAYGKVKLTQFGGLFDNLDNLSEPVYSEIPRCMEKYGYGYTAYQTVLDTQL